MITAEYIWLDGCPIMPQLRSKTRMVGESSPLPEWGFDGGSTYQAGVHNSDLILKPVRSYKDPFRKDGVLVLCEVMNQDGTPHPTNFRSGLAETVSATPDDMWFGFEQEYTLLDSSTRPIAWGFGRKPTEQGEYYCGVGAYKVYHRDLVDKHFQHCLKAGVNMYGLNAEVMPGQWEFQTAPTTTLQAADDLWIARYILDRVFELEFTCVSYNPKPELGWNGAGCHTNFSTSGMREDFRYIVEAINRLSLRHDAHMAVYGEGNLARMTGDCETSNPDKFTVGDTDRSCSVRIPLSVLKEQKGYLEDRRPAANIDPYRVCDRMLKSVTLDED
jgi:glutamine synthetase